MYEIAVYCKGTLGGGGRVGVWWDFLIVIPLQVKQFCPALDCGNMYVIALYCKDKNGGVVVGLSDGLWQLGDPEQCHNQMNNIRLNCIILNRWKNYE